MACTFTPLPPLFISLCIPLHYLENFIGKIRGSDFPYAQPNLPHICQTPLLCTILAQISPLRICRGGGEKYEHKISFKSDGDGRDGNGAKFFASLLHCWYNNPVAILSLCFLAHIYHVEFQLVKKNISGCDCDIPRVYVKTSIYQY